jgi:hypothetical protein
VFHIVSFPQSSHTKTPYAPLLFLIRATWPAHLILADLMTRLMFQDFSYNCYRKRYFQPRKNFQHICLNLKYRTCKITQNMYVVLAWLALMYFVKKKVSLYVSVLGHDLLLKMCRDTNKTKGLSRRHKEIAHVILCCCRILRANRCWKAKRLLCFCHGAR